MDYFTVASSLDRRAVYITDLPDRLSNYYELSKARPMKGRWPSVMLSLSERGGDMLVDFIENPDAMLYVSAKAKDVLLENGVGESEGEFLPFVLNDKRGRPVSEQFYILNLLRSVACFDYQQSEFSTYPDEFNAIAMIERLHLQKDKIPPEARLFRLAESLCLIIIRSDLVEAIERAGLTGLRVLPLGADVT